VHINFKNEVLVNEALSPENILAQGFLKMQKKGYRKSEEDAAVLAEAGKKMGIAEEKVRELYNEVDLKQSVSYLELSPAERAKVDADDIKKYGFPKLEEVHSPFEYDDVPSLGHIQLEEHRKQRHYNRVAAYELPQLSRKC
jgi:small subunit ribosomal protein S35